jgi:hypothetical protein
VHNGLFQTSLGEVWGLCTELDDGFRVDYAFTGDVRKCVMTVLHELRHCLQFERGEVLDCDQCDDWASDLVDYVLDNLK